MGSMVDCWLFGGRRRDLSSGISAVMRSVIGEPITQLAH
jgi:hypothetical protein